MAYTVITKGTHMARKKEVYTCTACGRTVTVYVKLVHPPTCSAHTGGGRVMKPAEELAQ